jgi:ATP-dependent helicase HrpA
MQLRPAVRREIARVAGDLERSDLTDWTIGSLPQMVEATLDGHTARGYPALVDDGTRVQLRVLTTATAARAATRKGVRRLLLLSVPLPRKACARLLDNEARLALGRLGWATAVDLVDDAVATAVDALVDRETSLPADESGFRALQERVARALPALAESLTRNGIAAVIAAAGVADRLRPLSTPKLEASIRDVEAQVGRLVHPGFLAEAGADRAPHLRRYLDAIDHRLTKLRERPERDRELMSRIRSIETRYATVLASPSGSRYRWTLEELRVSLFAQQLGTAEPVSESRLVGELSRLADALR